MDEVEKAEQKAPEWLNKTFLEDILRKNEEDKTLKVTNFSLGPAAEKGAHFASIMFRITVDYITADKPKNISLILKTMPVLEGAQKEFVGESNAFETEIKMYSEIIPKFHKMLKDIGDNTRLGAKMLYSSLDPIKIIVFEDLKEEGYKMIPNKYLAPNEIDALLAKICRWHALSFMLLKEGYEPIKEFTEPIFNLKSMEFFFMGAFMGFLKFLMDNKFDPVIIEKFNKVKDTLKEKAKSIYQHKGDLCVLNHGDFHSRNLMIKTSEKEKIDDLMLVDFQFCVVAPLVVDLSYILYTILDPHCRDLHEEIIYKYHTLFADILEKLGYKKEKIPTLIDIRKEMMRYKEYEVLHCVVFLPFHCAIKDKIDMTNASPEQFMLLYEGESFVKMAKIIVPQLLHRGYLD